MHQFMSSCDAIGCQESVGQWPRLVIRGAGIAASDVEAEREGALDGALCSLLGLLAERACDPGALLL